MFVGMCMLLLLVAATLRVHVWTVHLDIVFTLDPEKLEHLRRMKWLLSRSNIARRHV